MLRTNYSHQRIAPRRTATQRQSAPQASLNKCAKYRGRILDIYLNPRRFGSCRPTVTYRTGPWDAPSFSAILLSMGILIGMDEAGYGPNLGPLVVAATAWHVEHCEPDSPKNVRALSRSTRATQGRFQTAVLNPRSEIRNPKSETDLYRRLRKIVARSPSDRRVPIADSKALYNPATGLRHLERGLHAVLLAMQQQLSCWSSIVEYCGADPDSHHRHACWPEDFDCTLPIHAEPQELARLGARFARACDAEGVRPLVIRARLIFPKQFNELVDHFGNKATALSHITIALLREVMDCVTMSTPASGPRSSTLAPRSPIHAVCDKHGGRNFYTSLLQHHFSEHWISPVFESRTESHYEWGPDDSRTRVVFRMNGESFLPTALASMTAKYLRELAMKGFNEFWTKHVPDLRPTAGYYNDSRRFKQAIEHKQRELKIDDHLIWRSR